MRFDFSFTVNGAIVVVVVKGVVEWLPFGVDSDDFVVLSVVALVVVLF